MRVNHVIWKGVGIALALMIVSSQAMAAPGHRASSQGTRRQRWFRTAALISVALPASLVINSRVSAATLPHSEISPLQRIFGGTATRSIASGGADLRRVAQAPSGEQDTGEWQPSSEPSTVQGEDGGAEPAPGQGTIGIEAGQRILLEDDRQRRIEERGATTGGHTRQHAPAD
jgi:hypothetical protein